MPERFTVVCTIKALYKCSDLPFTLLIKVEQEVGRHSKVCVSLLSTVEYLGYED